MERTWTPAANGRRLVPFPPCTLPILRQQCPSCKHCGCLPTSCSLTHFSSIRLPSALRRPPSALVAHLLLSPSPPQNHLESPSPVAAARLAGTLADGRSLSVKDTLLINLIALCSAALLVGPPRVATWSGHLQQQQQQPASRRFITGRTVAICSTCASSVVALPRFN